MIVTDGRGVNKTALGKENKKRVATWFEKNPGATIKECCDALGFSYKTVRKHIDDIKKGE